MVAVVCGDGGSGGLGRVVVIGGGIFAREEVGDGNLACAFGYVQGGASVADGVVFDFLAEEEDYCFNVAAKYGAVEGWFVFSVERVEFGAFVEEHTRCPNTAVEGRWFYYHLSSVSALVLFNLIPVMYRGGDGGRWKLTGR